MFAALEAALRAAGLAAGGPPERVRAPAGAVRYELDLDSGPALATIAPTRAGRSREHALAARQWGVAQGIDLFCETRLVGDALIESGPRGGRGRPTELEAYGISAAVVYQRLSEHPAPRFGLASGGFEFWPTEGSWADEVIGLARALREHAVASGIDLGERSAALLRTVEQARESLERCASFALVHRDLGPETMHLGEPLRVTGWDRSGFGDPLMTWASALLGRPASIRAFVETLGPVVGDVLGDDHAVARLEAYVALYLLDLAVAEGGSEPGDQLTASSMRQRVEGLATDWPGVRPRLEQTGQAMPNRSLGDAVTRRWIVERLAGWPDLAPPLVEIWLAAAASVTLGLEVGQPDAVRFGLSHAQRLPGVRARRPGMDGVHAREAIVQRAAASSAREGSVYQRALAVAWLGLEAIDALDGTVSGAVWRGLLDAVTLAAAMDAALDVELADQPPRVRAAQALPHAILGLAASQALGVGEESRLAEALARAATTLGTQQSVLAGVTEPVAITLERVVELGLLEPRKALVPALLLAYLRTEDQVGSLMSPDVFTMLYGLEGGGASG